jgi:PAS domain S-box-containing protein
MTPEAAQTENEDLRARLEHAEDTIRAIQQGAVDAFVLEELASYRVFTLESADHPYRLFVEQMQQGVATLDAEGTIVYCNRRLAEFLKMSRENVVGARLRDFVARDDLSIFKKLLLNGQTVARRGETRLRRADGAEIPVFLSFHNLSRDTVGLIGVFVTDLTEQKHHEQLAAAQEALREADRHKDEFLAVLAHELRNPLTPIRNAVDILRAKGDDPAVVRATTAMLERQVGQIVRLVEDLLDVSRISRNRIELRKERIELGAVLRQAVESVRSVCDAKRHELTVALPPEPVFFEGDHARLTQVFTNLLENACKYTPEGGRLRIDAQVSRAAPGARTEIVVSVSDCGIGIAPDQLSRIFEMFTQVDTSLDSSRSGLGIGLTLVKHLVDLHGGQIEVHSNGVGQGSEFIVRLPARADATAAQPKPAPAKTSANFRILVADDNQDSADTLAMVLRLGGHEARATFDGAEAFRAAAEFRPDAVLLDIAMPKMNGYDACRRIRSESWGKAMTLIAQTGWDQAEDKRRIAEAGFDAHVVKPVDPAALLDLIESLAQRA